MLGIFEDESEAKKALEKLETRLDSFNSDTFKSPKTVLIDQLKETEWNNISGYINGHVENRGFYADKEKQIYVAEIEWFRGAHTKLHIHRYFDEIVEVIEGSIINWDGEGNSDIITPNSLNENPIGDCYTDKKGNYIIPNDQIHKLQCLEESTLLKLIYRRA